MAKKELEFSTLENLPWAPAPGGVPELTQKILASEGEDGVVTRLLRWAPGADTSRVGVLTHTFWEEIYILEGSVTDLRLNRTFTRGMYACRPPGMPHGPWRSPEGCLMFEVRYNARKGNA